MVRSIVVPVHGTECCAIWYQVRSIVVPVHGTEYVVDKTGIRYMYWYMVAQDKQSIVFCFWAVWALFLSCPFVWKGRTL